MTECNQESFSFAAHFSRRVEAGFTAGQVSSDGGALLVARGGPQDRAAGPCGGLFHRWPSPLLVKHRLSEMLSQRIYGLALGYEDLNDHEQLRRDPLLGLLSGKRELDEPLAGKSTLNRLELTGRSKRYHKIDYSAEAIDRLLADLYHRVARRAASPDRARSGCDRHPALRPSAGAVLSWLLRQLLLSAAVHLRRRSVVVRAAPAGQPGCGCRFGGRGQAASWRSCVSAGPRCGSCCAADSRLLPRRTDGLVRGRNHVDYLFGLARNSGCRRSSAPRCTRPAPASEHRQGGARLHRVRLSDPEELVVRTPRGGQGRVSRQGREPALRRHFVNRRAVGRAGLIREVLLRQRGEMENRIKEQMCLFADRLSTDEMKGNQLRLYFSAWLTRWWKRCAGWR